jgi:ABC-2 type transport system permease protein
MQRYIRLYAAFLSQQLKRLLEYRVNFLIGAASIIVLQGFGLLTIWIVMQQVPLLAGWNFAEVMLLYGFLQLSRSFSHMFADNLWVLGRSYIRPGGFDRFLVRPIDPLFHLLADRFNHDGVGTLLVGLVMAAAGSHLAGVVWTPLLLVTTLIALLGGGLIYVAVLLITSTFNFWLTDALPITRVVHETYEFARYPLAIYPQVIRVLLTWIIPFALTSYYPVSLLLGRDAGLPALTSVPVALVMLFIGYRFWLVGLRAYRGTGT